MLAWLRLPARSPATASSSLLAEAKASRALLGAARVEIGHRTGLIKDGEWSFVWVVDAPMFESSAEATESGDVALGHSAWTAVHHAFTPRSPSSWILSTLTRVRLWRTLTTLSATVTRLVAVRSVFTAVTCRNACSL